MDHSGGCLCGAIRYRAIAEPDTVDHCHCRTCRRASGGAFMTLARFPSAAVEFSGPVPGVYRSSAIAVRSFCPACGSSLALLYDEEPESLYLAVGTLDRPQALEPSRHIWTSRRLSWVVVDEGLPQYPRESPDGR